MNENGTVTRASWDIWAFAAMAANSTAKPAKLLNCLVIFFVLLNLFVALSSRSSIAALCTTNPLSGAGGKAVLFSGQNLVQAESEKK